MGHLQIRHLDDAVIERLILRAEALGVSVEQWLRDVVTAAVQEDGESPQVSDRDDPEG
ncbi:MAG: hypothetical protein HQL98_02450 [Magnetococcales bacterium]|nr:hypothetical protein [Magnetococcales bacterium]